MKTKPVNDCPVPRGILMAIGGKENRGEDLEKEIQRENEGRLQILKTLITLTKKDNPSMEVITTASSEADKLFE